MAVYSQFKLPPLKLTVNSRQKRTLHPGIRQDAEETVLPSDPIGDDQNQVFSNPDLPDLAPESQEPTFHELQCKSSVRGWEQLRERFLLAFTEGNAMPLGESCFKCTQVASCRCQECGVGAFYCEDCWISTHNKINIFHVAENWEVWLFSRMEFHSLYFVA